MILYTAYPTTNGFDVSWLLWLKLQLLIEVLNGIYKPVWKSFNSLRPSDAYMRR